MLDRIDIRIEVPRVDHMKLTDSRLGESSEAIRARVEKARTIQRQRFGSDIATHADMRPAEVRAHCQLDEAGTTLVRATMAQLQLSARAFHRILKLARPGAIRAVAVDLELVAIGRMRFEQHETVQPAWVRGEDQAAVQVVSPAVAQGRVTQIGRQGGIRALEGQWPGRGRQADIRRLFGFAAGASIDRVADG